MRRPLAVLTLLVSVACGGRSSHTGKLSPQTPNAAVAQFMDAVKANDLTRMGTLFGSPRGAASTYQTREYLERQLSTIQKYWDHAGYRILEGPLSAAPLNPTFKDVPNSDRLRDFKVELQRSSGCSQPGLLTVVRTDQGGWLVYDAHLESVGNPAARCSPTGAGTKP